MWSRPGMQRDRSRWKRSFGFSRSGFGGRILGHLTGRRSRSAWCGILKARRGGPPWCWLRRRLLGKDFLKNQNANYAEVIKTWSNKGLENSTRASTQYRLHEVVFGADAGSATP